MSLSWNGSWVETGAFPWRAMECLVFLIDVLFAHTACDCSNSGTVSTQGHSFVLDLNERNGFRNWIIRNVSNKKFSKFAGFAKRIRIRILHRLNPRPHSNNDAFDLKARYEVLSFVQLWKGSRAKFFYFRTWFCRMSGHQQLYVRDFCPFQNVFGSLK